MAGSSLIEAATIQKAIKEVTDIQTAINTFRLKYNCLPGDCANATSFFGAGHCDGSTETSGTCNGNGDGKLYGPVGAKYAQNNIQDPQEFWQPFWQMKLAGLLNPVISAPGNTSTLTFSDWIQAGLNVPASSLNSKSGYILDYVDTGEQESAATLDAAASHCFLGRFSGNILVIEGTYAGVNLTDPCWNEIKGTEAYAIDNKLDDGIPSSGRVVSSQRHGYCSSPNAGTTDAASNSTYIIDNSRTCALGFRLNN